MIQYLLENEFYSKENAIGEIWDLLESSITETSLNNDPQFQFSRKQIKHINRLFRQSKELFEASKQISIYSMPLNLFYGCSNLSKVLILKNDCSKSLENLQGAHGLEFKYQGSDVTNFENYSIKIQERGTFVELLNTHKRPLQTDNYYHKSITLKDLLNRYVDIFDYQKKENQNHTHPVLKFSKFYYEPKPNSTPVGCGNFWNIKIALPGENSEQAFQTLKTTKPSLTLDNFKDTGIQMSFEPFSDKKNIYVHEENEENLPRILHHRTYDKQDFIYSPINSGLELYFYQEEIQYMIAFIFSNVCRYYADIWIDLIEKSEFLLVKKALHMIYRSFPNYILNRIVKKNILIFIPGILERE